MRGDFNVGAAMRKRHYKKLWDDYRSDGDLILPYGLKRSRGSRKLRRGRRRILKINENWRDRSSLPVQKRLDLIKAQLARLKAESGIVDGGSECVDVYPKRSSS